jgi:hypothetical protein
VRAAGCEVIRAETASGTRRDGRTELQVLLDFLRAGDTLIVTRIDRLARSLKDLQDIVHDLKARGVALKATEQPIDTGTAAGKAFLDMLAVFAEFETNLRRERQLEGISAAKAGARCVQGSQAVNRCRRNPPPAPGGKARTGGKKQSITFISVRLQGRRTALQDPRRRHWLGASVMSAQCCNAASPNPVSRYTPGAGRSNQP